MTDETRIRLAIDHIKSVCGVIEWVKEIAVDAMMAKIPLKPMVSVNVYNENLCHLYCPACGAWIGESIEHIPGWSGRYPHKHCVADGTRAEQCPLVEVKTPHGDLIDRDELFIPALSSSHDNEMVGDIISDAPTVIEAEDE